jgi:hypothetical protein
MQLPGPIAEWSYATIQPLGRGLIGLWLWRVADESQRQSNETDKRF